MIGRPLIVCELLNLSRGPRMYLLRAGFAVFMAALAAIVWPWGGDAAALEHGGRSVFLAFFWAEFAAATLLVPALVAPAIAWERERKTLDLLSVAPVSDLEIVSGKFVAGAALSLSVLAAGLPVGVAAMVLGGTSPSGLLTTVLHLGAHAVFVCSLSIVASASVARSGPATALAVLLTGAFGGVSAIVSAIFGNALSGAGHPMLSRLAFSSLSPWVGIGRDLLGFETGWLDRCGAWAMLGVFSLIAIRLAGTILRASRSPGGARRRPVPVAAAATAAIPMAILPRPAATWHAAG
ncbi:MAG: ABC transporter permease subunit, partial [Candidatus Brocadiae bacterium]|nr:ABC transporter permease subunit [Candidatus Brocadiia bacterium]